MAVFMFPGQGSQAIGMGQEFFLEFKEYITSANNILNYDVTKLCLEDPDNLLNNTEYTQPALYIVNILSYLHEINKNNKKPDYLIGHSLGEYSALFAAGAFDFETGLKLVKKRGELMSKASGGAMAAVIGLESAQVEKIIEDSEYKNKIFIANYNSYTQVVISGLKKGIDDLGEVFLKAQAKLYIPLKVSGAFHSPFMQIAQDEFREFLNNIPICAPKIPVISNVTAKPYEPSEVKAGLLMQITSPVRFTESICYLLENGEEIFEEIGPGRVLRGLLTRILKQQ